MLARSQGAGTSRPRIKFVLQRTRGRDVPAPMTPCRSCVASRGVGRMFKKMRSERVLARQRCLGFFKGPTGNDPNAGAVVE